MHVDASFYMFNFSPSFEIGDYQTNFRTRLIRGIARVGLIKRVLKEKDILEAYMQSVAGC